MISLISMAVNAIISFLIYVLKAFFSMLFWFCGFIFKLLRLFFCALPFTAISFTVLALGNIIIMFTGIPSGLTSSEAQGILVKDTSVLINLASSLRGWWITEIYAYNGSVAFIFLLILTIIMFIPVCTIILGLSVFMAFGQLLIYAVLIDMAIYLIRILMGKNFASQFLDRYYRLFPASGKRHYEKNYEKWLRDHHKDFDPAESFYEDSRSFYRSRRDYDDEYDDDFEDDDSDNDDYYNEYEHEFDGYDDEYDDDYEDDYEDNDDDYSDEYGDADYLEEDYDDDALAVEKTNFDFFAGCSSKESVDKKYKSLVKLYHPDNEDGDTAALQEINIQYTKAKKKFGN